MYQVVDGIVYRIYKTPIGILSYETIIVIQSIALLIVGYLIGVLITPWLQSLLSNKGDDIEP